MKYFSTNKTKSLKKIYHLKHEHIVCQFIGNPIINSYHWKNRSIVGVKESAPNITNIKIRQVNLRIRG